MKADGHLSRNFLRGAEGDAANVMLAAAGHNLRLLLAWLAWLLAVLITLATAPRQTGISGQPQAVAAE